MNPGTIISHYEIVERLGGGGMGIVYRAEDTKLKRQVALKFLPSEFVADDEANRRFVLEAQTASSLNHPNICTIHEIGETEDGRMFIAMALYEGKTLKRMLRETGGALDWEVAADIAAQIADALAAAHEKDIVHRDIKPANILITESGRAVLLDFGIAKLSSAIALTKTGSLLGTIAYMSPEQALAEHVDHRSDIWALGAVLYEMLCGRKPFEADYDQAVVYKIISAPHRPLREIEPELPQTLGSVVDRALEKDRDRRYDSVRCLSSDLHGLTRGERIVAALVPPSLARRWAVWGMLVGALVLILVAFGYRLIRTTTDSGAVKSIAVLPMVNLSGDRDQEYFEDGMTDALITELSKIGALRVIARRSVMRYKNSDKPLTEIAAELRVDAIVEGSVTRSEDAVRVNAQLVSAESDENVWAESFDGKIQDILALHTDVARSILDKLAVSLTPGEKAGLAAAQRVDPAAYEAYLKGQFYGYRLSPETFQVALEHFNRALEIDPNYADAYSGIARVWSTAGLWGGVEANEAVTKSREAVTKALGLDENLSEAYYTLALLHFIYEWNWEEAEEAFKRAIEISPNVADWHNLYGDYLNSMQRHEEALVEARLGVELDPLSALSHAGLGWILLCARDYEGSLDAHDAALRIDPTHPFALRGRWWLNHNRGNLDGAVTDAAGFYESQGLDAAAKVLRREYPSETYETAMRLAAEALEAHGDSVFVPSMRIARLYVQAGALDKALDLLERSVEERFPSATALNVDPHWDHLRSEPRFEALIRRLNLPSGSRPA